ncbi:MAG: stage 0 sporulation protein J, partial [Anaerolineales bacterium]|nr:stage 0 sporulation protein J [Anaerolineales bacterium]
QLSEDFGLTHEEIAEKVGKSRTAVSNTMRLQSLPLVAKAALSKEEISEGHARTLLSLPNERAQIALLEVILKDNLSVRQAERLAQKYKGEKPPRKEPKPRSPEITSIEDQLRISLGTKVHLTRGRKGGTISIRYYSDEELNSLIDRLTGE